MWGCFAGAETDRDRDPRPSKVVTCQAVGDRLHAERDRLARTADQEQRPDPDRRPATGCR